jgi:hypothetical protein
MTYLDLTKSALAVICEEASTNFGVEDYYTRAQYLLATFLTQYAPLDAIYRDAHGIEHAEMNTNIATVDPEDDFPLCEVFVPAAVQYLASALIVDENEEMSDKFFDRYINLILEIRKTLPATQGAIVDRYDLT